MVHDILLSLWFFIPAGTANAGAVIVAHMPVLRRLNTPLDFGVHFHGHTILGHHKTWRGLIAGILFATATLWVQQQLAPQAFGIHYAQLPTLGLGALFGIGALGGDALKSFFKRRTGTAPGHSWFPFDQLDYIIGAGLATSLLTRLPLTVYIWSLVLWLLIHLGTSYAGYRLKLKDQPI